MRKKTGRPASENQTEEQRRNAEYMREWYRKNRVRLRGATDEEKRSRRREYRKLPHVRRQERRSQLARYHARQLEDPDYLLNRYLKVHGLDAESYRGLLFRQDGGCAVCGAFLGIDAHPANGKPGRLFVDHDHATGAVRGLLCNRCNQGIGLFKDRADVLRRAADYLEGKISWQSQTQ